MIDYDHPTGPGELDRLGRPSRRSGERRLEAIANNSLLKVAQFAITTIAVPLLAWAANTLGKIQDQLQQQDKTGAVTELRLLSAEKTLAEAALADRHMRERVLTLELQLQGIQPTTPRPKP